MAGARENARLDLELEPDDAQRIANLNGPFDSHLRQIELRLGIEIKSRGNRFQLVGMQPDVRRGEAVLKALFDQTAEGLVTTEQVHLSLAEQGADTTLADDGEENTVQRFPDEVVIRTKRGVVRGRSKHQKHYLKAIATHDLSFGIGPAGTGKTYLAVASAVHALERDRVRRIVLVRPAVEADEMLGFERVARLVEKSVIEVAPLAFMRGRTLNESFVILDEAQNTTIEQMKMFLTRIGFGSVAVVTGDVTQIDLPRHERSGLKHAMQVLEGVQGISFTLFQKEDVVRH